MAIFRGNGGAGDATGGVTLNTITELTLDAENSATEAATSASNAATSATSAANSASAASTSATNSSNSATAAATSATNSANSATASASSASAAASSASAAASSASDAETAQTAAEAAESNAATSASNAASSASSASSSASTATTQATNAASSASAAATSATNAANSATTASGYVSDAADQVTLATTQATNAANSATSASTSASSAASSAAAAASSLDSFDDRYLGAKSSAPTLDNDGNALITGALYYDTTEGLMFVYDGGQWIAASSASQAILTVYKYTATSGQTTFSGVDDNAATLGYTAGSIIVTLNGVFLESGDDYTATNGSSVVLSAGATTSDEVNIYSFNTFDVANVQVIGDERYVRLSTDQTVAGTKTLSSNPVLSAGTANGVTYLNGSKVLTSGSALTTNGSSLGVGSSDFGGAGSINVSVGVAGTTTGGLQLWSTTTGQHYVQFGDGTAGAATYAGAIGYSHATDQMFFYANGSEQMRLTSTGMGIGTSSPIATQSGVDISSGGLSLIIGADNGSSTRTNAGNKSGRFAMAHYTNAEEPFAIALCDVTSTTNELSIGGGSGACNTATVVKFFTAANNTTVSGSERARIDSSGNLGLGVTPSAWWSSQRTFQIGRSSSVSSRTDIGLIDINDNNYTDAATNVIYIADGAASKYRQNAGSHQWLTAPSGTAGNAISFTQAMTLDASGNLGIGTTSPSAKLQVDSSSATYSANIRVRNSNFGNGVVGAASGILTVATDMNNIAFYTGSNLGVDGTSVPTNERMRIDSSGNVGIGTSSPDVALDVVGEAIIGNGTYGVKLSYSVGDTAGIIDTGNSANKLSFRIGNSEKARIESGGNLLLSTGRSSARGLLDVPQPGGTNGVPIAVSRWGDAGAMVNFYSTNSTTTLIGSISNSGGTSTSYNTSSDYRLKEDWVAVADASTRVNALKPVNFAWIASGERVDGFLAHELAEVVPEAVTGEKDAVDAEGNPQYQGIDQSKLVPLLTAALQEALAKIDDLTARVSALEGN
jgi:hypothetical protein